MTDTTADLRQATDDALAVAHQAIGAAHHRISTTDIDAESLASGGKADHADDIAHELSAITLPLGVISRIRRRRNGHDGDVLGRIRDYDEEMRSWRDLADLAQQRRDDLIRQAITDGITVSRIAEIAGIARERVYQIRDGRR